MASLRMVRYLNAGEQASRAISPVSIRDNPPMRAGL